MKNSDSHIFLYAKGWYKKTEVLEDLRVIYSKRNGVDINDIDDTAILVMLSDLVFPYLNSQRFNQILVDTFTPTDYITFQDITPLSRMIINLLIILQFIKVKDIQNGLDEPDYSILPKSNKGLMRVTK